MSKTHDLLFEIGVEELPSSYVPPALAELERGVHDGLAALRLPSGAIETYASPRRLTVLVHDVPARQTDHEEEAMGPAVKAAYDDAGNPTRALLGFCQGRGVDVKDARRVQTPKGEYVAVTVKHVGREAGDVLPAMLADAASRLTFPKTMRWTVGTQEARFARPVRWLVALLGDHVLAVEAFGITAGRTSMGHRFLARGAVEIHKPSDYLHVLEKAKVVADHRDRERRLRDQVDTLAAKAGGRVVADDELVEINDFLVEWPTAFTGRFHERYLDLPREVIVTALREHQRFFAVEKQDGALLPAFIAVRNGDDRGLDTVLKGNQDVLVARLDDARFYWDTDLKHTPAERIDSLANVVWMEGLGSLRDKATRLESLGTWLAKRLAPDAEATVTRAALICKTDLLGEMIGSGKEYASLEGIMGGHYARRAGEPDAVAAAIAEHYRPRGAGDDLPDTDAGSLLSLADKLDHVAGAFVAGKVPSGSEDPYGVRRAGNGVIRMLIEQDRHLDLRDTTMEMTRAFFAADPDLAQAEIMKKLGEFWRGRVEVALDDRDIAYDTRDAALEAAVRSDDSSRARPGWIDPADALARAKVLAAFRSDQRFEPLVILFKRVANILAKATEKLPDSLDAARLTEPAEKELLAALEQARTATAPLWQKRAYAEILPVLLGMDHAIHSFFDRVLVNAEDPAVRVNRLRLLSEIRELFLRGWDLSKVVVAGE